MANSNYRVHGSHPHTVVVGNASPSLAPGEFVELSAADVANPVNAALLESGWLVAVKSEKPKGVTNDG